MKKKPWLVFGAIGVGAALAGACGSDDDGGGSNDTDGTTGSTTTGNTTGNPNTTGTTTGNNGTTTGNNGTTTGNNSTTGNSTTGNSTTGSGGGGGEAGGGGAAGEGGAGGEAPVRPSCSEIPSRAIGDADGFEISSPDFENCGAMPEETTCNGKPFPESVSPELTWTEGPEDTLSYAITFTDVTILATLDPADPLYNRGYHYVIWDIPADTLSLPAELGSGFEVPGIDGALQWAPFNDYGYMGPCANFPVGGEVPATLNEDSYSFTIYAMPTATLPIPAFEMGGPSFPRLMDDYLKENALAAVEYRGTSSALATTEPVPPDPDFPCPTEGDPPDGCLSPE